MEELKQALESTLFLIDEYVSTLHFRNGNVGPSGIDEGEVYARKIINGAKQTLSAHMTRQERENSPIFNY